MNLATPSRGVNRFHALRDNLTEAKEAQAKCSVRLRGDSMGKQETPPLLVVRP